MLKKNLKSFIEKSMVILVVAAMLAVYLTPLAQVFSATPAFAATPLNPNGYAMIQINGATALEDLNDADSVDATFEHGTLTVSGAGLYSSGNNMVYAPVGGNVTLDANGIGGYSGNLTVNGTNINGSTHNLQNLQANQIVQVDAEFSLAPTESTVNYDHGTTDAVGISINGVMLEPGSNTVSYEYNNSGTVTISLETFATMSKVTAVTINEVNYTAQLPTTNAQLLQLVDGQTIHYNFNVPFANTYNITTTTARFTAEDSIVGSFLWSYLDADKGTDDYIDHGHLSLIKVKYNNTEYTEEQLSPDQGYLQWGEFNDGQEGGALLPVGSEVTVSLIPDAGYQLTSFTINGGVFETGEAVGTYTFVIPGGNFHLGAHFAAVADAVAVDSDSVESGTITLGAGEINSGTARLDVSDVDLDAEDVIGFEDAASGYNINTYLDISLYQITYKGSADATWDSQITELDNEATITLQLDEGVDGNEIVIVHQKHDDTYEVIPTTYDPIAHTITFKTSSFSNYAIASRTVVNPASPESGFFTKTQASAAETISVFGLLFSIGAALFIIRRHLS